MTLLSSVRPPRSRIALGAVSALACALFALPASAQDDDKEKKRDPEIAEKLDELKDAIRDRKFAKDGEAVSMIDELKDRYPDLHPKDQRDVLKGIEAALFARPYRKPEQPGLYRSAIFALGTIGAADEDVREYVAASLVKAYGRKPFKDEEWLATREDILENIGRTKTERKMEFLIDEATRSPIDGMKRGAGKALRHYSEAEGRVRKEIFEKLLIDYATIEGKSKQSLDSGDAVMATATATLKAIRDPWNATLAALSGANHRSAEDWQKWWNDHKNDRKLWR